METISRHGGALKLHCHKIGTITKKQIEKSIGTEQIMLGINALCKNYDKHCNLGMYDYLEEQGVIYVNAPYYNKEKVNENFKEVLLNLIENYDNDEDYDLYREVSYEVDDRNLYDTDNEVYGDHDLYLEVLS